jgi:predicted PurR-regulated permease PerM
VVSPQKQMWFWGVGFLLFAAVLWGLGDTLLPFVLGAAIAYFLDPVADRLETLGLGRAVSTTIIGVGVVLGFVVALLLVVPTLLSQARELIEGAPALISRLQELLVSSFPGIADDEALFRRGLTELQQRLTEIGPEIVNSVLASSLAVVDFVLILVVAPVVAFYLLLDWDRMVARIDQWLPREHAETVRGIFRDIDRVLSGFVRGQGTVCLILGLFYAIALTLIGLPFGFLVGMVAGILSFIPYVGTLVGGVLSIGIALVTFWTEPLWIGITVGIFVFGQFVEGNILSPRLIGRSVGLHPVLLILALAIFGKLFGFAGLLVAVPVAAALGVIGRFLVGKYLESPLYTGRRDGGLGGG